MKDLFCNSRSSPYSFRNSDGLSLIELIVAAGIVGILSLAGIYFVNAAGTQEQRQVVLGWMGQKRIQLYNSVTSNPTWILTTNANSLNGVPNAGTLSCLTQPAGCASVSAKGPVPLDLLNTDGSMLAFGSVQGSPLNGYNLDGSLCQAHEGSSCPIQLSLQWHPQCGDTGSDPNCNNPLILVTGTYSVSPSANLGPVNLNSYNFSVSRSPMTMSVCSGTPNPGSCGGLLVCAATGWTCIPMPKDCASGPAQWTVGGVTCTGTLVDGTSGSTQPVASTSGNVGNASFTCNNAVWNLNPGDTCTVGGSAVNATCGTANGQSDFQGCLCLGGVLMCGGFPFPSGWKNGGTLCATGNVDTSSGGPWAPGAPAGVTGHPGDYTWTCDGIDGGTNSNCAQTSGNGHGMGCFPAGSPVQMSDGTQKNIEDIVVGDQVLSWNENLQRSFPNRVVKITVHPEEPRVFIHIQLSNGQEIEPTDNHPIWIQEFAKYLEAGDVADQWESSRSTPLHMRGSQGELVRIRNVTRESRTEVVYDLSVGGAPAPLAEDSGHNFFIRKLLVHNKNACFPSE